MFIDVTIREHYKFKIGHLEREDGEREDDAGGDADCDEDSLHVVEHAHHAQAHGLHSGEGAQQQEVDGKPPVKRCSEERQRQCNRQVIFTS